jgi:hypothetical protein
MANYTGNFIQINPEQASKYVLMQLRKHDAMTNKGIEPTTDPYREPVIMTLDDARQVEIPDEIQRAVIAKHVSENAVTRSHYESEIDAQEINHHTSHDDDDEQSATSVFFQVAVCLVIIMTILYLLSLARKGMIVV